MFNCLKCEYKKLISKKEFYLVISLCILLGGISVFSQLISFQNHIVGNIPMASRVSMINADLIFGSLYSWIIMPIFIALVFADIYANEQSLGCSKVYLLRSSRFNYFFSKAIIIAFISFIVAVLPFVISEVLCLVAFPKDNYVVDTTLFSAYLNSNISAFGTPIFKNLFYNHRYLNNIILILFNGIVGINIGLFTFVLTLNYKFKRALVCAVSSSIYIAFVFIVGNLINEKFFLINYMGSGTFVAHSILFFIVFNIVLLAFNMFGVFNKINIDKDIF